MGDYSGLIFLALPLLLLYMVFSRMRRQQRQMAAIQAAVAPGLSVMTTSGVHATVVSSDDGIVVLEIAPGVHTRWALAAIAQVFDDTAPDQAAVEAEAGTEPRTDAPSSTEPQSINIRTDDVPTRSTPDRDDRTLT